MALASPMISIEVPNWEPILKYGEPIKYKDGELIVDIGDVVKNIYFCKLVR
ncbi:hypothetical protein N752_26465 [Desulforamulus aquiferis]|nr:hypothetical protein [Desulforamulus aquiferis]RYD01999.1 hypothetical protein N752_26465 [Desulforamulus aquiferis]